MKKTFLIVLFFFFVSSALADTRSISGLLFDLDSITTLDDGTVEVVIGEESRIVEEANVDDYILKTYFNSELVQDLSIYSIQKYIKKVLEDGDFQHAALAFEGMLRHPKFDEDEAIGFVSSLKDSKTALPLFKEILLKAKELSRYHKLSAYLVLYTGLKVPFWFDANYVTEIRDNISVIKSVFDKQYFSAIHENDIEQSKKLLLFEKQLFGDKDELFQKHSLINEMITNALAGLRKSDLNGMQSLIAFINRDIELQRSISPVISENLHAFIKMALARDQFQKALLALSLVDPNWRTETTHNLLIQTFEGINKKNMAVDISSSINSVFQVLSQNDATIKNNYINCLAIQFRHFLISKDFARANLILSYILAMRPDPNEENDILRAEEILVAHDSGDQHLANMLRRDIHTSLPLSTKLKFLFAGIYFKYPILIIILSCLVLILLSFYILKRARGVAISADKVNADEATDEPSQAKPIDDSMQDFREQSSKRFTMKQDEIPPKSELFVSHGWDYVSVAKQKFREYQGYVQELGIPADSDVKLIKTTYRSLVKDLHPDFHPDQSQEDIDKFIHIQDIYQKLLKLRSELGLPE